MISKGYLLLRTQVNHSILALCVCVSMLIGCSTLKTNPHNQPDCTAASSSCHSGRFGLVWQIHTENGLQNDSITGTYSWKSGSSTINPNLETASLELRSTLGPTLGQARQTGKQFEATSADGKLYLGNDWQTLFNLIFPLELPANALVDWMKNPRNTQLPELPPNWAWENRNDKYRIRFNEPSITGRIDIIPQYFGQ